jgi:hypothetical protein
MKLNQNGSGNGLILPLIVVAVLLVASLIFGGWAFNGRQTYKNKTDQIVALDVTTAKQQQQTKDAAAYRLAAEQPLISYTGPEASGSIVVKYPKTWSSFVDSTGASGQPVDGYFFPGTLPSVNDNQSTNFALRLQVENNSYATLLQQYTSSQESGEVTITPYSLPLMPKVIGVKVVGQILNTNNKTGTLIILPLRSSTLEIWTEGVQYLPDFNNNILPNVSFSP